MLDIMLDLETLGTKPGAIVTQIGAVAFDRSNLGSIGFPFWVKIDIESAESVGLELDARTVKWWLKQSDAARHSMVSDDTVLLIDALSMFHTYVKKITHEQNGGEVPGVWGNGAAFDNVLLRTCYETLSLDAPWPFWQDRCFRTMKNVVTGWNRTGLQERASAICEQLNRDYAMIIPTATHTAIYDAVLQAVTMGRILNEIGVSG